MFQRSVATLVAGVLCLSPVLGHAATALGAETPQAVVARMNKAATTKDFSEMTACLDRESRVQMSAMMMMGAVMMVSFMGMGAEMAAGMGEAMGADSAEAKAKMAAAKKETAAKTDKAKAALTAAFKKHGLPDLMDEKAMDKAGDPKEVMAKIDHPAFVKDMMAVLESVKDKDKKDEGDAEGPGKMPDMKSVTDYKVTGDTATAMAGNEKLDFVKEDGRWFLKMPEKKAE